MPVIPRPVHRLRLALAGIVLVLAAVLPATALGAGATKVVRYHGYRLTVPAAWPVYNLFKRPATCVRFDRHAVYLGRPSQAQLCPTVAAGRTEAILVEPQRALSASTLPLPTSARATRAGVTAGRLVDRARGVVVTATWNHRPAVIRRALGVRSLAAVTRSAPRARSAVLAHPYAITHAQARAAAESIPGQVYTGSGFDACSTPSSSQMAAWGASPYRALGVYIGGANMACSQPNLTASWVSEQSVNGWHLIPIYVDLQAPSNSCGCQAMSSTPSVAASQGATSAADAVVDAQAIGLGAGNPLYLDMEGYTRTATNSAAVLAFEQGWTQQLHAAGYRSGIYSSDNSGIVDLVGRYGTGYVEPDDLWIANWNNAVTTADGNVPSTEWAAHQRLHQYRGAHNETYGGVRINIDGDYLDASTAAAGTGSGTYATPTPAATPSLKVTPMADGTTHLTPSWRYATGVASWQLLAGSSPTSLAPLGAAVPVGTHMPIVTGNNYPYYAVTALGAEGQTLGTSPPVDPKSHLAIFGRSVFIPRTGLGGVPAGCASTTPCRGLRLTVSSGRKTLVRTGPQRVPVGGGLLYFKMTPAQHAALWKARRHEQKLKFSVRGPGLATISRQLTLVSFNTSRPNPKRSLKPSSALRLVGSSDFVSNGWVGGILAECTSPTPCQATTKIVSHGTVIAQTGVQTLGVGETGYLKFILTPAGHQRLMHTLGNQMPATVTVTSGGLNATGHLALTGFN